MYLNETYGKVRIGKHLSYKQLLTFWTLFIVLFFIYILFVLYRAHRISGNTTAPQVGRLLIRPYPSSFPVALVR
jgi:hypothetical protein